MSDKPGNFYFRAGKGGDPLIPEDVKPPDGDIVLTLADDTEMIRLRHDGAFLVKGEKVADDFPIYKAFREWLIKANIFRDTVTVTTPKEKTK